MGISRNQKNINDNQLKLPPASQNNMKMSKNCQKVSPNSTSQSRNTNIQDLALAAFASDGSTQQGDFVKIKQGFISAKFCHSI